MENTRCSVCPLKEWLWKERLQLQSTVVVTSVESEYTKFTSDKFFPVTDTRMSFSGRWEDQVVMRRIHRAAMILIPSSLPCDCHSQMVASILCLHLILCLQHKNCELSSILLKLIRAKHPSCRLYHKLWLVQMNVSVKITWEWLLQMLKCFVQKGSNFTY